MSSFKPGPDPDFPYLSLIDYYSFPNPKKWNDSVIAVGGNLSPGMLLSAYEQGIFPWYGPEDPVIWQSPDPRFVLFPDRLHISSSMKKILKNKVFEITFDKDFYGVINGCAQIIRQYQNKPHNGTWITKDIVEAYTELHRLGFAHSVEAWQDGELAGGCYGILMGRVFIGESMFAKKSNASKAAFLTLAQKLFEDGIAFIDCQTPSSHLGSMGGEEISREGYLALLKANGAMRY
ncbi:MAG: leucyl/phenylalanyl-tRNA--protein transferase [Treponema sp.]|jgi:leucyl/phenylalanyl-tRNA--protein transferase|nr:leucyl/phenylalanyl-tRNA--protein transferase [Treponema sp.]